MASKIYVVFCCFLALVVAEKYTDKYDNIDIDEITSNERLLNSYVNCILDLGKCTPEGLELKSHLGDALEHDCEKCTETQMDKTVKVIRFFVEKKPEVWKQMTDKYDPTGKYSKKYEERAKKEGIVLP